MRYNFYMQAFNNMGQPFNNFSSLNINLNNWEVMHNADLVSIQEFEARYDNEKEYLRRCPQCKFHVVLTDVKDFEGTF